MKDWIIMPTDPPLGMLDAGWGITDGYEPQTDKHRRAVAGYEALMDHVRKHMDGMKEHREPVRLDRTVVLPDHTKELLLALHSEFYGGPKADADAFRVLLQVVSALEESGYV